MVKKLLITAVILIIIGVVGCIFTYNSAIKSTEINDTSSVDYERINTLEINTISTDVEIIATKDQKKANIQLQGKGKKSNIPKLSVKVDGTKLIVDLKKEKSKFNWFQLSPTSDTLLLKIYLPEKLLNSFTFDTVSGDLYVENIHANALALSSVSGDIDGEIIQFEKATIETVSGDVNVDEISGKVNISTTSGDIKMYMKDLKYPMQIDSTSGDVKITTENEPTDITFKVDSVSGDINILDNYNGNATIGKGSTQVEINTISGDISVDNY